MPDAHRVKRTCGRSGGSGSDALDCRAPPRRSAPQRLLMATVRPFRALRPTPEAAERVASVPYDVVSSQEARELAEGNDLSFLHVIRPEIDLPAGTDEHADEVYAAGREARGLRLRRHLLHRP